MATPPSPPPTKAPPGKRAMARQARTDQILAAARQRLATEGAAGLSLRAIARDVGIVSSAVHRYFPTRDDLLTALIVEAYEALGQTAERSVAATRNYTPGRRWVTAAEAIREWGLSQPHLWALLYGTPVPGYAAPEFTVQPGTRATMALLSVVTDTIADAAAGTGPDLTSPAVTPLAPSVSTDLTDLARRAEVDIPPDVLLRTVAAWTQLFGLVSFELFGQTRNMVADDKALFTAATETMAAVIGLPDRR